MFYDYSNIYSKSILSVRVLLDGCHCNPYKLFDENLNLLVLKSHGSIN